MRALLTPEIVSRLGVVLFKPGRELMPLFAGGRVLIESQPEKMKTIPTGRIPDARQPLAELDILRFFMRDERVINAAGGINALEAWLKHNVKQCQCPVSPISYARQTLGLAMATDEASAKVFKNGMRPSGVLSMDQILKKEQRNEVRESMVEQFSGSMNTGKMMVLEAGMKFQPVDLNPEDAQMLQSRAFNIEEICRWFRVWPGLIGHSAQGQTMWGSGVEQMLIGFLTFSLRPWLTRIEQAVRKSLLAPGERNKYFAEFSIEGLLRADSAARAAFYSTMTQNGLMTRNEARQKENLQPKPGADQLTVQSNLLPIDQLGKSGDSESAKNALREWLGIKSEETPECTGKTQP